MGQMINRRRVMGRHDVKYDIRITVNAITDGDTPILYNTNSIVAIYIDDVKQDIISTAYPMSPGLHEVKFITSSTSTPSFRGITFVDCEITSKFYSIGIFCFGVCTAENIIIPKSVKSCDTGSFNNSHITNIYYEGTFSEYLSITFVNYQAASTAGYSNLYCNGELITDLSLSEIKAAGLYGCCSLEHLNLTDGITDVSAFAFGNCQKLKTVIIASTVTNISNYAFIDCISLESIVIMATDVPTLGTTHVFRNSRCPIYVPAESVEAYKTATNWSTYASRIQAIPT